MDPLADQPWLKCPRCGYDVRGLPENRCPECGNFFDPDELRCQFERSAIEKLPKIAIQTFSIALALPIAIYYFNYIVGLIAIFGFSAFPLPGLIPWKAVLMSLFSEWIVGPTIVFGFYQYRLRKNGIPLLNWATLSLILFLVGEVLFFLIFVDKVFQ